MVTVVRKTRANLVRLDLWEHSRALPDTVGILRGSLSKGLRGLPRSFPPPFDLNGQLIPGKSGISRQQKGQGGEREQNSSLCRSSMLETESRTRSVGLKERENDSGREERSGQ